MESFEAFVAKWGPFANTGETITLESYLVELYYDD